MNIFKSKTHIDFETPIQMTETQLNKLIKFMKKTFPDIDIIYDVKEASKEMGAIERTNSKWTVDDYLILLEPHTNEQVESMTEKSEMSIKMKRGSFIPEFYSWMKAKKYTPPFTKKMLKEFLKRED
ncbi:MAG: hypothetical protein KAT05_02905 [Spirochaetes bacterium]|nr:hypothetical protein [Spirochaetota bacterium]